MSPRRTSSLTFQYHLSLSVPGKLDTRLVEVPTDESESHAQQGSIFPGNFAGQGLLYKSGNVAASAFAGHLTRG